MLPYIVVDASVAGAWSFNEPYSANAVPVLAAILGQRIVALAPDRFEEELLSICRKKAHPPPNGPGLLATICWEHFEDTLTSPVPLYLLPSRELHERAWQLSVSIIGLTVHDALYLALAERWGAELWTLDEVLGGANVAAVYPNVHDLRTNAFPY